MKSFVIFIISTLAAFVLLAGYSILASPSKTLVFLSPIAAKKTIDVSGFSLEQAPSQSLPAAITLLKGEVNWQSRVATQSSLLTQTSQIIQQGELVSTGKDGQLSLNFEKNGIITLAAESSLNVIQTQPEHFVVEQPLGSITYQNTSSSPISVRSLHLLIEQQTGSMTVAVDEDGVITATVAEGTVTAAFNDKNYNTQVVTLNKGEELTYDEATQTVDVNR